MSDEEIYHRVLSSHPKTAGEGVGGGEGIPNQITPFLSKDYPDGWGVELC